MLLYKPWRRRIDKKREQKAHFVPLPQSGDARSDINDENVERIMTPTKGAHGAAEINIAPARATDAAGPAGGSMAQR